MLGLPKSNTMFTRFRWGSISRVGGDGGGCSRRVMAVVQSAEENQGGQRFCTPPGGHPARGNHRPGHPAQTVCDGSCGFGSPGLKEERVGPGWEYRPGGPAEGFAHAERGSRRPFGDLYFVRVVNRSVSVSRTRPKLTAGLTTLERKTCQGVSHSDTE
jgi:hypothetical protein